MYRRQTLGDTARGALSTIGELFYPQHCALCGVENPHVICSICFDECFEPPDAICMNCGRMRLSGIPGDDCGTCHRERYSFKRARSFYTYDGRARELFLMAKFTKTRPGLAVRIISEAARHRLKGVTAPEFFDDENLELDAVVEVPAYTPRWLQSAFDRILRKPDDKTKEGNARAFNLAKIIAHFASVHFNLPWRPDVLKKVKNIPSQVRVEPHERKDNVRGAFSVAPGASRFVAGKNVLLADDLLTTGSTASECTKVLKRAGAKSVHVLTLFSTVPKPSYDSYLPLELKLPDEHDVPPPVDRTHET